MKNTQELAAEILVGMVSSGTFSLTTEAIFAAKKIVEELPQEDFVKMRTQLADIRLAAQDVDVYVGDRLDTVMEILGR